MTLSGRVDALEDTIGYLVQDLLTKPSIDTISTFNTTWNQTFYLLNTKLVNTIRDVEILQSLYANLYDMSISGFSLSGDYIEDSFETISKNLKQYNASFFYDTGNNLTGVYYRINDSSYVYKNFHYTSGSLAYIELTGNPLPSVTLHKGFSYSGESLTGIRYY